MFGNHLFLVCLMRLGDHPMGCVVRALGKKVPVFLLDGVTSQY